MKPRFVDIMLIVFFLITAGIGTATLTLMVLMSVGVSGLLMTVIACLVTAIVLATYLRILIDLEI